MPCWMHWKKERNGCVDKNSIEYMKITCFEKQVIFYLPISCYIVMKL